MPFLMAANNTQSVETGERSRRVRGHAANRVKRGDACWDAFSDECLNLMVCRQCATGAGQEGHLSWTCGQSGQARPCLLGCYF